MIYITTREKVWPILQTGFPLEESGGFGKGFYFTRYIDTPNAIPKAANIHDLAIIISMIAPGNIFPLIEKLSDTSPISKLKEGLNSYYTLVGGNNLPVGIHYIGDKFDQLVISDSAQAVPKYLIFVRKNTRLQSAFKV